MDTLDFAGAELKKYLLAMGQEADIRLRVCETQFDASRFVHYDNRYDDAFTINVKKGQGEIVGINARSVLFGVYHFLKLQGARFLRPGPEGEYIPQISEIADVEETVYANLRHRGMSNCSKCTINELLYFFDWMPKMMMNTYFFELPEYLSDMQLYGYNNSGNPNKRPVTITREQYRLFDAEITRELKKRAILRHAGGHGWTVSVMKDIEIHRQVEEKLCENSEVLALVNGVRRYHEGKPLNTNLCYSNTAARHQMVENIVAYAKVHDEVDFLHVWLGDGFSNFCECENCARFTPTDWYVILLNEIDKRLTEEGLETKIVFLAYFELMYPPKTQRLNDPDRFVLMFAPFGRDFFQGYEGAAASQYRELAFNRYVYPEDDVSEYLAQLSAWQKVFSGDSFVFDYRFFSNCFMDVSDMVYAKVSLRDGLYLKQLGLNGQIDCGSNHAMSPTALSMHLLYNALFYGEQSFEKCAEDYFVSSYGPQQKVQAFLKKISGALPYTYVRGREQWVSAEREAALARALEDTKAFQKAFDAYFPPDIIQRENCRFFAEYLDVLAAVFELFLAKARGEKVAELTETLRCILFAKEAVMPRYMSAAKSFYTLTAAVSAEET